MILTVILLFGLAALFGLTLAVMGVRYRRGSLVLSLGHAGTALLALTLLMVQIVQGSTHMLYNDAALLFFLALAGGVVLLALRATRRAPHMLVIGLHGSMAALALLLLVVGYTRG